MTIVRTHYRSKRPPRKRGAVALQAPTIVKAADPAKVRKPRMDRSAAPTGPVEEVSNAPTLSASDSRKSAIVTIRRKPGRFGDAPDLTQKEINRRRDAADA